MNGERPLAKGWCWGWWVSGGDEPLRMIQQERVQRGEPYLTYMPQVAPPECYECYANPDTAPADAPLAEGQNVWVHCPPHLWHGSGPPPVGRARVCGCPGGRRRVDVQMADGHKVFVPPATIHREGPQGPPPVEGATFLGQHRFRGFTFDYWWLDGRIARGNGTNYISYSVEAVDNLDAWHVAALAVAIALGLVPAPEAADQALAEAVPLNPDAKPAPDARFISTVETPAGPRDAWWRPSLGAVHIGTSPWPVKYIESPRDWMTPGWLPAYRKALARAVELGFVEAEPEPGFVVGQVMENKDGFVGRIGCISGYRSSRGYGYQFCVGGGGFSWYEEADLAPHEMTVADVPDETLLAIMRGKPVRVVDVPVDEDGRPMGQCSTAYHLRGSTFMPLAVPDIDGNSCLVEVSDGFIRGWNLAPATDA